MACGCSSSSYNSYSSPGVVSNGCGVPSGNCALPQRSAHPPVVPLVWKDSARAMQMSAGVLLVRCGDEIGVLDAPMDGVVKFDAATQKVYVSGNSVESITDLFACTNDQIFGFPLYGVRPECRDMGENPDRRVAVVRPPNSAFGTIYAHQPPCTGPTGLLPEVTPVQLVPAPLPDPEPTGLLSLAWRPVAPTEECPVPRREHFGVPAEHVSSIDGPNIRNWDIPAPPLTAAQDADFGLAAWLYNPTNTKWELQKVGNSSLQTLIGSNPITIFDVPHRVYYQHKVISPGVYPVILPTIPAPSPMPIIPETVVVDLTTIPGWDPAYRGVIVSTFLKAGTVVQDFDTAITIDGIDHVRTATAITGELSTDSNEKFIKFNPTSKSITIDFRYEITSFPGFAGYLAAVVYISGFFR